MSFRTRGTLEWSDMSYNIDKCCSNYCWRYCYACANALRRKQIASREEWQYPTRNIKNVVKGWRKIKLDSERKRIMFPTTHDITDNNVYDFLIVAKKILRAGHLLLITTKPRHSVIKKICEELDYWKRVKHLHYNKNDDSYEPSPAVQFRFTINHINKKQHDYWEPGSPSFGERMDALITANYHGHATSISIEPWLDINTVIPLILQLQPHVTESIWLGPMNKKHLADKKDWNESNWGKEAIESLYRLIIDNPDINRDLIRYKDAFVNAVRGD